MSEKELRELDAWIAENVMGWAWWERPTHAHGDVPKRKILYPPDPEMRANFYPDFRPAQEATPRFSDWDRGGITRTERGNATIGIPRYSTDRNALAEAERRVGELGHSCGYVDALLSIVDPKGLNLMVEEDVYACLTATPAQKAAAIRRAVEGA